MGLQVTWQQVTYQDQSRVQVEIVGHNDSSHYTQTLQRRVRGQITTVSMQQLIGTSLKVICFKYWH